MKTKLILIIALGLGLTGTAALAHDEEDNQGPGYGRVRHDDRIGYEVNHLNRMLNHVRGHVGRYGGGWQVRRELGHISREVDRVNWKYRNGGYSSYRLRGEIAHIHAELHSIEQRLHFRSGDWYRWN